MKIGGKGKGKHMAVEIERKFRVASGWKPSGAATHIAQGYLSETPDRTVRVRRYGDSFFLTVKGRTDGISRLEFEYTIPMEDGKALLTLCPSVIEKDRYEVDVEGSLWEVDVFHGGNEGLTIAEIELPKEDAPFSRPDWLGEEVTGDVRYYNAELARHPYRAWKEEEKLGQT